MTKFTSKCLMGNDSGNVCLPNYTDKHMPYGYSDRFCPVHGSQSNRIYEKPNVNVQHHKTVSKKDTFFIVILKFLYSIVYRFGMKVNIFRN